jgi:hypothetical protein
MWSSAVYAMPYIVAGRSAVGFWIDCQPALSYMHFYMVVKLYLNKKIINYGLRNISMKCQEM